MQQFSKYKIITICFILMFIFAIAAIYTNTKDIVAQKAPLNKIPNQSNIEINNNVPDNADLKDNIDGKLIDLTGRIDNLERKVYSQENNTADAGVRCRIQGITNDGHFVPMSDQDAINESKENNKEVVITCVFK